jgi:ABC-type multidrug transport system ATPase subunit
MELCDRIGVLDRGRLLAVGKPTELGAELTRNSFRAWLGLDAEAALDRLVARGVVVGWSPAAGMEDLVREFAVEVTDGHQGAAELVRALVGAGVDVARVERVPVSAADIIERVLASHRGANV